VDTASVSHRIPFARETAKTALPARERRLRQLRVHGGYVAPSATKTKKRR